MCKRDSLYSLTLYATEKNSILSNNNNNNDRTFNLQLSKGALLSTHIPGYVKEGTLLRLV